LISIPGVATTEGTTALAASMGPCAGKALVDCTNPLTPYPALEISCDRNATSATEEFAKVFPECGGVYKAFNIVGVGILGDPVMENGEKATMFYAGPSRTDAEASFDKVTTIVADVGFEPCYVGGPRQARNLESLAEMWMHMSLRYKDLPYKETHAPPNFAWKVLFR
jgi:8-hydroxy-5-deazaflavin:NADPH oxidoreductase